MIKLLLLLILITLLGAWPIIGGLVFWFGVVYAIWFIFTIPSRRRKREERKRQELEMQQQNEILEQQRKHEECLRKRRERYAEKKLANDDDEYRDIEMESLHN